MRGRDILTAIPATKRTLCMADAPLRELFYTECNQFSCLLSFQQVILLHKAKFITFWSGSEALYGMTIRSAPETLPEDSKCHCNFKYYTTLTNFPSPPSPWVTQFCRFPLLWIPFLPSKVNGGSDHFQDPFLVPQHHCSLTLVCYLTFCFVSSLRVGNIIRLFLV